MDDVFGAAMQEARPVVKEPPKSIMIDVFGNKKQV